MSVGKHLVARVFEAVEILLQGFELAAPLAAPLPLEHLHQDLLRLVLRAVFRLCAEDQGLLPLGVHELYAELDDAAASSDPQALRDRFDGYPRLLALVRGLGPSSPAIMHAPAIDDRVVHALLERLLIVQGQRLRYRSLDVEQLGAVYEALMGYQVQRTRSAAVRLAKQRAWIELDLRNPVHARARERVDPGRLIVQPGQARRRSGSHYTPRELTERIVRRTLEPILACLGPAPSPAQILSLKVCDPAMGSGAFLVEACRQLAESLVAAWVRAGQLAADARFDAQSDARRLIAQHCLYGVDKNPDAVELAKLSLWLVTQRRELPFEFVDHALRHGDSLVGLDLDQIASFHWQAGPPIPRLRALLDDALERPSARIRAPIHAQIRLIADACVGAFFAETKDAAREAERSRRLALLERWLDGEDHLQAQFERMAAPVRERHTPFHWCLEFPEVFHAPSPDPLNEGKLAGPTSMAAILGNPPFMGGRTISGALGNDYRDWLYLQVPGAGNLCDLCVYFFRRADVLIGANGTIGLVATNSICEGESRAGGLGQLLAGGRHRIYTAWNSLTWAGDASVRVSPVILGTRRITASIQVLLDELGVPEINSRLRAGPERSDPEILTLSKSSGRSAGCVVVGQGFLLSQAERARLIAQSPRNAERIFPYLGGEDINSGPAQTSDRHIINFHDMTLEQAAQWPDLLALVRARVKPERDRLRDDNASARTLKSQWWRYQAHRPDLYAALAKLDRCIVTANVTKHLMFSFQTPRKVFVHTLYVFPLASTTAFAVLQSRVHEPWARLLSSSLKTDLRYSASDCFDTFPFPEPDPRAVIPTIESAGQTFHDARARLMAQTGQGLTKIYNALKDPRSADPALLELRRLSEAMDRAVLAAYGWDDLPLPPYCPTSAAERDAHAVFEDRVIDRLHALNGERARAEQAKPAR